MSYRRCAAKTCFNTHNCKPNLKFFNYPKDEESCRQWVVNSGRLDFVGKTIEQISKFVLCADHFEEDCFINPKFKTLFKKTITPIPSIFRNNLADFVPKSLQKHCEALNNDFNNDFQKPPSHIGKIDVRPIYSDDELDTYIYEQNEECTEGNDASQDTPTILLEVADSQSSSDPLPPEVVQASSQLDDSESEQLADLSDGMGCHKMCRLCACMVYEDSLVSVFLVEKGEQSIVEKLNRILPEKVADGDGLPQAVCMPCLYKLNECDETISSFISADKRLRDLFLARSPVVARIQLKMQQCLSDENTCKLFELEEGNETEEETVDQQKIDRTLYPNMNDSFLATSPNDDNPLSEPAALEDEEGAFDREIIGGDGSECNDIDSDAQTAVELKELISETFELICDSQEYSEPFTIHQGNETGDSEDFELMQGSEMEDGRHFEIGHIQDSEGIEMEYIDIDCICRICDEKFPDSDSRLFHEEQHQLEDSAASQGEPVVAKGVYKKREIHTCEVCGKIVVGLKPFRRHMKLNHIPDENICEFCGSRFLVKSQLDSHRRLHTNEKPFVCNLCGATFHFKKQLKRHKTTHVKVEDDSPLRCDQCSKMFATRITLWRHKKTHTNQGNSLCFQCGKVLSNPASLRVHMRTHSSERPCLCTKCGKSYKDKVSLAKHVTTHTEEKNFPCDVCGRQFYSLALVRQHSLSHSGEKPHKCDLCNTAFNRLGNLNQHKKKHVSGAHYTEPQYECDICHKRVRTELTLKYHLAKHTGEKKPFDCDVCGKRFIAADPYRVHMRLHTGERPFGCATCDKTFRSLSTMKQHAALHEDEHPHECPYCERKFKRLQSLIVHRRTHTGEKPFPCHICSRAFAQRGDMLKHTKTHLRNNFSHVAFKDSDEPFVMQIENIQEFKNSIHELVLSDSDITSEYFIDMPIVEVETEIQSNIGS